LSVVLDFGLWARIERDEMRTVARRIGVGVELHYLEVLPTNSGGASRHGTRRHPGTTSQSVAPISTSG
ncbi:MAG TPA: hypothetical protein VLA29_04710, partial [Acidimicrobiia bacterium]|nr:hypothetical protein [Acidimicrobiia bacterium]